MFKVVQLRGEKREADAREEQLHAVPFVHHTETSPANKYSHTS